jgi:hypothetical protein
MNHFNVFDILLNQKHLIQAIVMISLLNIF